MRRSGWRGLALDAAGASAYLVVAGVSLARSVRPGRTLVPADVLTQGPPFRALAGGFHAHNPVVSDASSQFFPWFRFLGNALRHGGIPQWNPLLLGGVRVTPNGYVSAYYPPTWLVRWLSPFDAYNAFVLFHLFLGALGIYVFARVLGVRRLPAWTAGLLALAAAFWVHWSLHLLHLVAMVGLPWALVATHLVITRPTARRAAGLGAVLGLWWLGGNPQYLYFGTLATAGYAVALIVRDARVERRRVGAAALGLSAGVALGFLLAAPVVLPTVGLQPNILREREPITSTTRTHLPLRQAVRALVPDATGNPVDHFIYASTEEFSMDSPFVGVTAVLLGAAALGATRRRARWLLLAGVGAAVGLAFSGPPHWLLYHVVPGYDRFRGSARWLAVLPVFALPLAAIGLEAILDGERRARRALTVGAAAALAVVAGWYARELLVRGAPHAYLGRRALVAAGFVVAVATAAHLARVRPRAAAGVVVLCALGEIALNTPRWYPSVVERSAYPPVAVARIAAERGGRIVRAGDRVHDVVFEPDIPLAYAVDEAQGLDTYFPRAYDRYLRLIDDYGRLALDTNAAPPVAGPERLGSRLLDALDVRTVISSRRLPTPPDYPVLASGPAFVYARASAGPAIVVATAAGATERQMWASVADTGWDPTRTAAVMRLRRPVHGGPGTVVAAGAGLDHDRWLVDAPRGGFLRVSGR
ncbi:MAG: hypothetical protein E6G17_02495, partial [Actinobacteria bacterium]